MSALEKNVMAPAEATDIITAAFDDLNDQMPFSEVFPMKSTNGDTTVRWTPIVPARETDTMLFRGWDAEAGYLKTSEVSNEVFTGLIPLSKKAHVSERDLIGHVGDSNFLRDKLTAQITQLGQEAALRIELLRVKALVDAKFPVEENNISLNWDFRRPSSLQDVAPSKKWGTATATPLKDIKNWVKLIVAEQGRVPSAVLTTSAVLEALSTNAEIITAYTGLASTNLPSFISHEAVKSVLAAQCGLTDVREVDLTYTEVERANGIILPVAVSTLVPDNTFVMFSSYNDVNLGFTASGPTVEATNPEYEINKADNSGMIAYVLSDNAPARYDVWANGTMIPVLQQAVSTLKANVL